MVNQGYIHGRTWTQLSKFSHQNLLIVTEKVLNLWVYIQARFRIPQRSTESSKSEAREEKRKKQPSRCHQHL
jgi:hypothetical protein